MRECKPMEEKTSGCSHSLTEQPLTQCCTRDTQTYSSLSERDFWHVHHPTISPSVDRSSQHNSFVSLKLHFRGSGTSHTETDSVYPNTSTDILHRGGMQTIRSEHVTTVSTTLLHRAAVFCVCSHVNCLSPAGIQPCEAPKD